MCMLYQYYMQKNTTNNSNFTNKNTTNKPDDKILKICSDHNISENLVLYLLYYYSLLM